MVRHKSSISVWVLMKSVAVFSLYLQVESLWWHHPQGRKGNEASGLHLHHHSACIHIIRFCIHCVYTCIQVEHHCNSNCLHSKNDLIKTTMGRGSQTLTVTNMFPLNNQFVPYFENVCVCVWVCLWLQWMF